MLKAGAGCINTLFCLANHRSVVILTIITQVICFIIQAKIIASGSWLPIGWVPDILTNHSRFATSIHPEPCSRTVDIRCSSPPDVLAKIHPLRCLNIILPEDFKALLKFQTFSSTLRYCICSSVSTMTRLASLSLQYTRASSHFMALGWKKRQPMSMNPVSTQPSWHGELPGSATEWLTTNTEAGNV